MPNWKKVIVSGSNAVLNNITASGAISASGQLYAGLGDGSGISNDALVVLNQDTGELMYTSSFSEAGSITVTDTQGLPNLTGVTKLLFSGSVIVQSQDGGSTALINPNTLQEVTETGNETTLSSFFLNGQSYNYGFATGLDATSGFDGNINGSAYTHVTPQITKQLYYPVAVQRTGLQSGYPDNYLVVDPQFYFIPSGSHGPDGPGRPSDGDGSTDNPDGDGTLGILTVDGGHIQVKSTGSTDSTRGILFTPAPNIYFFENTKTNASGALMPASASAKIKFDTGSKAVKFFAGSTDEELKEVMHISKSGDNPRIGIGVSNPLKAFDFKDVSDTTRGGEILIRGSRTTKGAEVGDEAGRINFVIDSGSYGDVETSGSTAEIVALVSEVDKAGVKGSLSFRVATTKEADSIERIRITPDKTQVTGSFVVSGSNSFINIGPAEFTGSVSITDTLTASDVNSTNLDVSHFGRIDALRVGTGTDPGTGVLSVQDYGLFFGGVHVGGASDPGADNLIVDGTTTLSGTTNINGATLNIPNLTTGNATTNYDKLLIIDSSGQARTLAKSSVPYIEVFDGATPTNQTLVMFSGSSGDIANATGVSYNSGFGWSFSGVGSVYDITADDIFVTNDLTAVGDISAANGSFSGDVTVQGNIIAEQYIISSSVTHLTQSFSSGSTIFGDTQDDTHQFTGSLDITSSVTASGNVRAYNFIGQYGTNVLQGSNGDTDSIQFNNRAHWRKANAYISSRGNEWVLSGNGIAEPNDYTEAYVHITKNSGGLKAFSLDYSNNGNKATFDVDTNGFLEIHPDGLSTYFSGSITASGNISASGALISSELTASGLNYPNTDGDDGQVLLTDGSGKLTFGDVKVYAQVKNISGVTLAKGTPVHATASASPPSGNVSEVIAASASLASSMPATFVLDEELANEAEGRAILSGFINGVDTSAFKEGDVVYVGENGGYTTTKPTGTNLIQNLGIITKVDASNGAGYIYGSGRSNDVPNITSGYAWVGNSSGVATATATSSFVVTNADTASYVAAGNINGTIDISDQTNLAGGTNLTLSGDTMNLDANISLTSVTASGNISASGTIISTTGSFDVINLDRLSLTSTQTTVPPLQLTANSLQDGVGALRIDGSQADIFLNPSTATHTTVTFAVNNDQRLAFGMDNNSDFYITRRTGGSWYDDTFVLDRDTGEVSLGYGLSVTGNVTASGNISASGEIETNTISNVTTVIGSDSATNVDTFASSSYNGAIYDYILKDTGVGARAGQFMVAHDNGLITFTDNSTKHLSDATAPEISAQINGANIEVQVTNGNGYTFKSFVKKL